MKLLSRALSRFCYNHPKLAIPELMKYIAIGNVIVFVGDMLTMGGFSWWTRLYPELILQGQMWRLVTFVFAPLGINTPPSVWGTFLFFISTAFYYRVGTTLEQQWGSARFTVFYGLGVLLNLLIGLGLYALTPITAELIGGYYLETANMHYVNMSMFFSFATLYPEVWVRVNVILPLKVKWLAWLSAGMFAYDICFSLTARNWLGAALPIIAIFNYLLFFWEDLLAMLRNGQSRVAHKTSHQTINFKQAQKDVQQRKGHLHKCVVCGITDADNPAMDFRYCSKCNGYHCYCADHIANHTHVE